MYLENTLFISWLPQTTPCTSLNPSKECHVRIFRDDDFSHPDLPTILFITILPSMLQNFCTPSVIKYTKNSLWPNLMVGITRMLPSTEFKYQNLIKMKLCTKWCSLWRNKKRHPYLQLFSRFHMWDRDNFSSLYCP